MAALDALLVVSDAVVVTISVVMTPDVDFIGVVVLKHYRWFRQQKRYLASDLMLHKFSWHMSSDSSIASGFGF